MISNNRFIICTTTYPQWPAVSRVALSSGMQNKSLPHDKCLRAMTSTRNTTWAGVHGNIRQRCVDKHNH